MVGESTLYLYPYYTRYGEANSKWATALNLKAKIRKHLKENTGKNLEPGMKADVWSEH